MNVKRFTARSSRDALALVRQSLGDDAVVLSTKPSPEGVEVLAMAPDGVQQIERMATSMPVAKAPAASDVQQDVKTLSMSTLSFQEYVRERLLKRRKAEQQQREAVDTQQQSRFPADAQASRFPADASASRFTADAQPSRFPSDAAPSLSAPSTPMLGGSTRAEPELRAPPEAVAAQPSFAEPMSPESRDVMAELRSVRLLIEDRFGALAFLEKLQRHPQQAKLASLMLDAGFSAALTKKLVEALPPDLASETEWAMNVLERNLLTGEGESALEDQGGVYALVGSTGVGKTTTTAKIAAAFATRHGSGSLGLVTLDAYRVAAHEQLRTYGRILGVPVHTAHDRASLEDLLDLLSAKRLVLIDTAGTAQRDARTRELLDMVSHRAIHKMLVINASAQGETIDDVMTAYRAATCRGAVLSKIDEAVKLGPAIDALIRHKVPVLGVANGQRVPEDWHRLSAKALVQSALRERAATPWRLDAADVNLVFASTQRRAAPSQPVAAR